MWELDAKKEPKKIKADDALAGKLRVSHSPKPNSDPAYRIVKQGFLSQCHRGFLPLFSKACPFYVVTASAKTSGSEETATPNS